MFTAIAYTLFGSEKHLNDYQKENKKSTTFVLAIALPIVVTLGTYIIWKYSEAMNSKDRQLSSSQSPNLQVSAMQKAKMLIIPFLNDRQLIETSKIVKTKLHPAEKSTVDEAVVNINKALARKEKSGTIPFQVNDNNVNFKKVAKYLNDKYSNIEATSFINGIKWKLKEENLQNSPVIENQ